jgi:hypothetical protein
MEIKLAFNFIYTMDYNGSVIFLTFFNYHMVYELNHPLLTCWNHYLGVAFYT